MPERGRKWSNINKFCNANCSKRMYKGSPNSKAHPFHSLVLFTVRYLESGQCGMMDKTTVKLCSFRHVVVIEWRSNRTTNATAKLVLSDTVLQIRLANGCVYAWRLFLNIDILHPRLRNLSSFACSIGFVNDALRCRITEPTKPFDKVVANEKWHIVW